jgi:hypothetical protein
MLCVWVGAAKDGRDKLAPSLPTKVGQSITEVGGE